MSAPSLLYFDNNATTRIAPAVFETMVPWLTEYYGNPSSAYRIGVEAKKAVTHAREQVAAMINAEPREIIFTSCGTESDNAAIWSALQVTGKKHIVTSQVEHSAIVNFCEKLEKSGYAVTWLPVRGDGTIDPAEVEEAIRPDTAIVSLMWANNETGVLFSIQEIAEICQRRGVLFHTDAVQTPGKIPLDVRKTPVHLLSLSGHKLHAPKGVGVLYVAKGTKFTTFVTGGGQETGRRGGTENIASIVGLGHASEMAVENLVDEQTRVRGLRDRFEQSILRDIPGTAINGNPLQRLPNTSNISFEGIEAEALLLLLDRNGVCVSSGSACTTGSIEPSHVLSAMGLSSTRARSSLRFSFSGYNTDEEITLGLGLVTESVKTLRAGSPSSLVASF